MSSARSNRLQPFLRISNWSTNRHAPCLDAAASGKLSKASYSLCTMPLTPATKRVANSQPSKT